MPICIDLSFPRSGKNLRANGRNREHSIISDYWPVILKIIHLIRYKKVKLKVEL